MLFSENDQPEDLVRIWRPQALALGEKPGTTKTVIGRFLISKGVPPKEARVATEEIWAEVQKSKKKGNRLRLIIGWGLIAFSILFTLYTMFSSGDIIIIAGGPLILGAAVLWGGLLTNESD